MWHWEGWGRREREVESGGAGGRLVVPPGNLGVEGGGGTTFLPTAKLPPPITQSACDNTAVPTSFFPPLLLLHVSRGAEHARCRGLVSPSGGRAGGGWRARRQTGNTGLPCLQVEHVMQQRRTARKTGAARGAELIKHLCSRLQPAGFHSEPSWLLSA